MTIALWKIQDIFDVRSMQIAYKLNGKVWLDFELKLQIKYVINHEGHKFVKKSPDFM